MSETVIKEPIQDSKQEQIPLSEEEVQEKKEVIKAFYEEEIPFLKLRAEYEDLITKIEVSRFERMTMQMQMAQIMAPPPEENSVPQQSTPNKSRTLKKEK